MLVRAEHMAARTICLEASSTDSLAATRASAARGKGSAPGGLSPKWLLELYLRNRCICYWDGEIRVTPTYNDNVISDVLLVTNSGIDRPEFLAYTYISQLLGLSVNMWDLQRYRGMASPVASWLGKCRYVWFPAVTGHSSLSAFRLFDFRAHLAHDPSNASLFIGAEKRHLDFLLYDFVNPVAGSLFVAGANLDSEGNPRRRESILQKEQLEMRALSHDQAQDDYRAHQNIKWHGVALSPTTNKKKK